MSMRLASASWAGRSCAALSQCRRPFARGFRACRSSGAATFRASAPEPALNAPYVDYAIRGQGEETLLELLDALFRASDEARLASIAGLSWRPATARSSTTATALSRRPRWRAVCRTIAWTTRARYLGRTFLGNARPATRRRSGAGSAARSAASRRCFAARRRCRRPNGSSTSLTVPARRSSAPIPSSSSITTSSTVKTTRCRCWRCWRSCELPWWCFARADALLNLSESSWALVSKSRLRMAYIGAESPSDWLLHDVRKGTRTDQTLEAVEICRSNGVIPELSFMLAPPQDPEGETERTFEFIRHVKRVHPGTEIMLYIYAPLPPAPGQQDPHVHKAVSNLRDAGRSAAGVSDDRGRLGRAQWLAYWCHTDAPWLTPGCASGSAISPPCWVADFRPLPMCVRRRGESRRSGAGCLAISLRALRSSLGARLPKKFIRLWDPRVSSL